MKIKNLIRIAFAFVIAAAAVATVAAQSTDYRVSTPYTYKNLTIFLLHGKDQTAKSNTLTLQEAMERGVFRVYETSDVNELAVENLSKELDVFIQSGDIVKGGKQDRVLAVSIIIPARSGRVTIEAFCVESGRWEKRGTEDAKQFKSSHDRIATKELKIAANATRSQQEVWKQVGEAQKRLSVNVGAPVQSGTSASSLQLSLENQKVVANVEEYVRNLSGIIRGRPDVVGFAIAINGKVNSADVYVSNALFQKLWPKMLKASAVEAVAESRSVRLAAPVKADAVRAMITDSEKAGKRERSAGAGVLVTREDKDNVMVEARDDRSKLIVHKSYVRKN